MNSDFTEKEKIAFSNALTKLYDNLRISKAGLLDKAVISLGYTTEEIARDINTRANRFDLSTIKHEISKVNQCVLYDNFKRKAFIILQSIEDSIKYNKEVPFDYYNN